MQHLCGGKDLVDARGQRSEWTVWAEAAEVTAGCNQVLPQLSVQLRSTLVSQCLQAIPNKVAGEFMSQPASCRLYFATYNSAHHPSKDITPDALTRTRQKPCGFLHLCCESSIVEP